MLKYAATRSELTKVLEKFYSRGRRVILDYARENRPARERSVVEATSRHLINALPPGRSSFALKFTSFGSRECVEGAMESIDALVENAKQRDIPVCIDAEDVLYQDECLELMRRHNTSECARVYATYQMYRRAAIHELLDHAAIAKREGFKLGAKLVRGAYLGKQRDLFDTKDDVDHEFNKGMAYALVCPHVHTILATHNRTSIRIAKNRYKDYDYEIAQLMGMETPDATAVYVPTGSLFELSPYLLRRLQERTLWRLHSSRTRNDRA